MNADERLDELLRRLTRVVELTRQVVNALLPYSHGDRPCIYQLVDGHIQADWYRDRTMPDANSVEMVFRNGRVQAFVGSDQNNIWRTSDDGVLGEEDLNNLVAWFRSVYR